MDPTDTAIEAAEVVLPCSELDQTLRFFTEQLGFRIESVHPADDPSVAVIAAHGLRLRLERGARAAPGLLRLRCRRPIPGGAREMTAPNGTRIELCDADPPLALPPVQQSFAISRTNDGGEWRTGRVGMRYRDLIPDRQGGRFIASHIQIPGGGPVEDYVHFHRIRFQMIYCHRGWVRVVYQDQGPPFVLQPGDCVLQPPAIRHQVLESSPGLEVIELSSPAEHETLADHDLRLPTATTVPGRDFGGQRFVRHQAASARWQPWRPASATGFEARDLGIAAATGGVAGAHVIRVSGQPSMRPSSHGGELLFMFVLKGSVTLDRPEGVEPLAEGDAFAMPAGVAHALTSCSGDLELLEVTLPAE